MYRIYYTTIKNAQPLTTIDVTLEEIPNYIKAIRFFNPDAVIIIKASDSRESSVRVFYEK